MRKRTIVTILLIVVGILSTTAKGLMPQRLTCMMREGMSVIDDASKMSVGWQLSSDINGARQTAYEIIVRGYASGKQIARTGKILSARQNEVAFPMKTSGKYVWQVRVWDENDSASDWSEPDTLFIQTADEAFGNAKWIGAITRADAKIPEGRNYTHEVAKQPEVKAAWAQADTLSRRSIYVGTKFQLPEGELVKATANVCGLGFYEAEINGERVGDATMAPLWSDYDKSVFYNTYDITDLLRKGENKVRVLLGNGFYNEQGGRYRKLLISFGPPTLRMRMELIMRDAEGRLTKTEIVSDETWKWQLSEITFNSIYGGEDYDARLEGVELTRNVVVQKAPKGKLRPQIAKAVRIMERYDVKNTILSRNDTTVFDMGQNLAGFPEITLRGQRGQKVKIWVAETLRDDGLISQKQTGKPHYYVYTLKGDGEETWHPRFSYYSFQFIQIEGAVMSDAANTEGKPIVSKVQSCFIYNSTRQISSFHCDNDLINSTHRLIERAVRSNMQSVFTDCPAREKLGWLEQDYLNGASLTYNLALAPFIEQTMQNIADAQWENGGMPTTAPEYLIFKGKWLDPFRESPEWGGALVFLPYHYWQRYGSDRLLRKYYENMRRYVDYLTTKAQDNIVSFGLGDWYDYGEGRAGFSKNTPVPLVATAHYFRWTATLAKAARIIGRDADANKYQQLANSIRNAFNSKFFNTESCQYGTGSQTSNAIALTLGMVVEGKEKCVLQNLENDIIKHGCRLTTGDVGNLFLFTALSENNRNELLYKMLNHYDVPGYGYQIKQGATTLTEQWDPTQGASRNHFMMGQIDQFLFSDLAGIRIEGNRLTLSPKPIEGLNNVIASTESVCGKISTELIRNGAYIIYKVEIPPGMIASVVLPGRKAVSVDSGKHEFKLKIKKK